jgi:hypothetical protein
VKGKTLAIVLGGVAILGIGVLALRGAGGGSSGSSGGGSVSETNILPLSSITPPIGSAAGAFGVPPAPTFTALGPYQLDPSALVAFPSLPRGSGVDAGSMQMQLQ